MVQAEGEGSLGCQQLFGGLGMDGDSIGRVCLDIAEDADVVDSMREMQWGSAREVWELRQDACHEPSNEATVLCGIE